MDNPGIPQPSQEIFKNRTTATREVMSEEQTTFWVDRTEYPPEGGIYVYKFGASMVQSIPTPERLKELEDKTNKLLPVLVKFLDDNKVILVPGNNEVILTPLEMYEAKVPKPDLETRVDRLYPAKGFPTPEAIVATNLAKRYFITQVQFLSKILKNIFRPIKLIEAWLKGYTEMADMTLFPYYLEDIRYSNPCRELRLLVKEFMIQLGIDGEVSEIFARTFATLIEYDTAYRYRIEDIMSETTKEKLLKDPRKEIKNLLQIFAQRENRPHLVKKFRHIGNGLSIILLIPKVRKAFNKALNKIDFSKLQLDEADRYNVLCLNGYEFMGRDIKDRIEEYLKLHNGNPPRPITMQAQ